MKTSRFYFLYFCFSFFVCSLNAQLKHEHPDHPKGNSATIYKALPFYNEACELYEKGHVSAAKKSLHEAIATSFALTEAHLFLGEIYYIENVKDSALYFLKSGIDFAIEQQPHFYFHLFELALDLGQYDILKQNLIYFKNNYNNQGVDSPYEEGYDYNRSDLEFYEECIDLIYDYKSWTPKLNAIYQYPKDFAQLCKAGNNLYVIKNNSIFVAKSENKKFRKLKGISGNVESFYVTEDQKDIVLALKKDEGSYLFKAKLKGRKAANVMQYEKINVGNWQGTPFLISDKSRLYFSSNVNGNKDIFVVPLDESLMISGEIKPLSRINTTGDEQGLFIDEVSKQIYYSSTGLPGFGGSDIFICKDFEVENGSWFPINPRNFGASINTHHDEVSTFQIGNKIYFCRNSNNGLVWFRGDLNLIKEFNYDITAPKIQETNN